MSDTKTWTLKSIAAELGVSNATVSNAFNRPDQLSEKKRADILEACARLGYYGPNKAAQSLRKGKFNIVALVLPDSIEYMVSDPVASDFMKGVSSVLENSGTNILLFSGRSKTINDIVDFVDGFICYGQPRSDTLIEQLKRTKKKVVTVDFDIERNASVNIDNLTAAREIANIALASKEDSVAILGLRLVDSKYTCRVYDKPDFDIKSSISHQRLQGYLQVLEEKQIELGKDRIWSIPESNAHYADIAVTEALSSSPRPNVLLCMSDLIALSAISLANRKGLNIPEDIRIVGFDGIDEAARSTPALTTVHQNSVQKGKLAAEIYLSDSRHRTTSEFHIQRGQSA